MKKIYIDGQAGTTGLRIRERLAERDDVTVLTLPEEKRKDTTARREIMNSVDVVFLCLPDAAAREAVTLTASPSWTSPSARRSRPPTASLSPAVTPAASLPWCVLWCRQASCLPMPVLPPPPSRATAAVEKI